MVIAVLVTLDPVYRPRPKKALAKNLFFFVLNFSLGTL